MKGSRIVWCLLLVALAAQGCKNQYLTGYYSKAEFISRCQWRNPVASRYAPDAVWMDSIRAISADSADVVLFLGTWCSDSKKWVPRFFALQPQLPIRKLQIVSSDTTKRDELKLYRQYQVDSIPTFIFFRNEVEIGRIKVKPLKVRGEGRVLERDIYYILGN